MSVKRKVNVPEGRLGFMFVNWRDFTPFTGSIEQTVPRPGGERRTGRMTV